jgi:ribosomal protein L37AE/L43A
MGALFGASVGGGAGYKVGDVVDEARKVYICNQCGRTVQGE